MKIDNGNLIAPPSEVIVGGERLDLSHGYRFEGVVVSRSDLSVCATFCAESSGERIFLRMTRVSRCYVEWLSNSDFEDYGVLTMIGWTHMGYPNEYRTYSLEPHPDGDWDLTIVVDEELNIKFGGGCLEISRSESG